MLGWSKFIFFVRENGREGQIHTYPLVGMYLALKKKYGNILALSICEFDLIWCQAQHRCN